MLENVRPRFRLRPSYPRQGRRIEASGMTTHMLLDVQSSLERRS